MKKLIIVSVLLNLLVITACDSKVFLKENNKNTEANEVIIRHEDDVQSSNDEKNEKDHDDKNLSKDNDNNGEKEDIKIITHENNPLLELASQGRINNIQFVIGSPTDKIIEEWGLPDEYDYFLGGLYFIYDNGNIIFFTGAESINGEILHDEVKVIGIFEENKEIFNVRIGMSIDEIIEVLGNPTHVNTPEQNEESELLHGDWIIVYDTGKHEVIFASNTEKGPVYVAYLRGKN